MMVKCFDLMLTEKLPLNWLKKFEPILKTGY